MDVKSTIRPRQRVKILSPGYETKPGTTINENGHYVSKWTGVRVKRWLVQVEGIATPLTFVETELRST